MAYRQSSTIISTQLTAALECIHSRNWALAQLILDEAMVEARKLDPTLPLNRVRRGFIAEAMEAVNEAWEAEREPACLLGAI